MGSKNSEPMQTFWKCLEHEQKCDFSVQRVAHPLKELIHRVHLRHLNAPWHARNKKNSLNEKQNFLLWLEWSWYFQDMLFNLLVQCCYSGLHNHCPCERRLSLHLKNADDADKATHANL